MTEPGSDRADSGAAAGDGAVEGVRAGVDDAVTGDGDALTDIPRPAAQSAAGRDSVAGAFDTFVGAAEAAQSSQVYRALGIILAVVAGAAAVAFDLLAVAVVALGIALLVGEGSTVLVGIGCLVGGGLALLLAVVSHPVLRAGVTAVRRPAVVVKEAVALAKRSGRQARDDLGGVGEMAGEFRRRPVSPRTWWKPVQRLGGFAGDYLPRGNTEPVLSRLVRCTPAFLLGCAWTHAFLVVVNLILLGAAGYLMIRS